MDYLPLFLLMAAALIAGWFYLQRAKARDAGKTAVESEPAQAEPAHSEPAHSEPAQAESRPADRPE